MRCPRVLDSNQNVTSPSLDCCSHGAMLQRMTYDSGFVLQWIVPLSAWWGSAAHFLNFRSTFVLYNLEKHVSASVATDTCSLRQTSPWPQGGSGSFGIRRNQEERTKNLGIAYGVSCAMHVANELRRHTYLHSGTQFHATTRFRRFMSIKIEAHESQRCRSQESGKKGHEDHIAGRVYTSMTHYNLVRKPIVIPRATKMPDAKSHF